MASHPLIAADKDKGNTSKNGKSNSLKLDAASQAKKAARLSGKQAFLKKQAALEAAKKKQMEQTASNKSKSTAPIKPNQFSSHDIQFFESKIRPLLVKHCYECHSSEAKTAEGGLLVDSRPSLLEGGDSGRAVVVGKSKASLFTKAIEYHDEDLAMPPEDAGGKLSDSEIKLFAEWIDRGLPDTRLHTTGLKEDEFKEAKQWWSYQPLQHPQVPNTKSEWPFTDIDRFVAESRDEAGLRPSQDASPEILLRRIHFDLTGLPPTFDEWESFQQDLKSNGLQSAYEVRVDQLLASNQFGVHWGRHWLDVARYAESSGRDNNVTFPDAWRYRDYVIDSFNQNRPYDDFLRQQLAGDLMPAKNDKQRAENLIATGFLAVGSKQLNEKNARQFDVDQADEQIDTVFQATMGLTVACARCHDHKFDPVTQHDYTAVAGIFLSSETHFGASSDRKVKNDSKAIQLPLYQGLRTLTESLPLSQIKSMKQELAEAEKSLDDLNDERRKENQSAKKGTSTVSTQSKVKERNQLENKVGELNALLQRYDSKGNPLALAMGVTDKPYDEAVSMKRANLKDKQNYRRGFVSISDSPFFARGDIEKPGDAVARGVPSLLGLSKEFEVPDSSSGRWQLARWITRASNPLTARVAVNRTWSWLIGQGIVSSVDNFGTTGAKPSHPELLDYLATQFIHSNWNTKKLIREIVLSRTYRMSSHYDDASFAKDPENLLLWRMNPRRLEAESIRDAILCVSGTLDDSPQVGSQLSFEPSSPVDRAKQKFLKRSGKKNTEPIYRSIYLPLARNELPEVLELFDAPDATTVQGKRDATNVPSQALFLLNSDWISRQSKLLASRLITKFPGKGNERYNERIEYAYQLAFVRKPTAKEMGTARNMIEQIGPTQELGWTSFARALFAAAEFRYLD